jgi:hypothetical protein
VEAAARVSDTLKLLADEAELLRHGCQQRLPSAQVLP